MPSVRKLDRQFCCTRSHAGILWCTAPQSGRSSHSLKMQEQLPWRSLTQWMLPCRASRPTSSPPLTLPLPTQATWVIFMWTAKGRTADAAETESFSYTRATRAPFCLNACLSLTRCILFPLHHLSPARDFHPSLSTCSAVLTQLFICPFSTVLSSLGAKTSIFLF